MIDLRRRHRRAREGTHESWVLQRHTMLWSLVDWALVAMLVASAFPLLFLDRFHDLLYGSEKEVALPPPLSESGVLDDFAGILLRDASRLAEFEHQSLITEEGRDCHRRPRSNPRPRRLKD